MVSTTTTPLPMTLSQDNTLVATRFAARRRHRTRRHHPRHGHRRQQAQ